MSVFKQAVDTVTDISKKLNLFTPVTTKSINWKYWMATLDWKTCKSCSNLHGKVFPIRKSVHPSPPLHPNCRCSIIPMQAVDAGHATHEGQNGADWWISNYHSLPPYYLSLQDYMLLGWKKGKSPSAFAPGKMMTAGIYSNHNAHLPTSSGRIWYEADLNYYTGKRNSHRLLWSNDGLVFVTYDHYKTFIEVK